MNEGGGSGIIKGEFRSRKKEVKEAGVVVQCHHHAMTVFFVLYLFILLFTCGFVFTS